MASVQLWSCADDMSLRDETEEESGYITLTTTGLTRSTEAGEDIYNENKISSYTLVFYKADDGDCETPVLIKTGEVDATNSVKVKISVTDAEKIFPHSQNLETCQVYALVNLPEAIAVDESDRKIGGKEASLENINELKVEYDFGQITKDSPAANFVMKGNSSSIEIDWSKKEVSGEVKLDRLASKLRLWLNLPEKIFITSNGKTLTTLDGTDYQNDEAFKEAGGRVCKPVLPNEDSHYPTLKMRNGAKSARIDGKTVEVGNDGNVTRRYLSGEDLFTTANAKKFDDIEDSEWPFNGEPTNPYYNELPLYSYPNRWTDTPDEEQMSSIQLSITWVEESYDTSGGNNTDKSDTNTYYYEIPINEKGNPSDCMESNHYYRVGLTIGMLGSKDAGNPLEIKDANWEVLEWVKEEIGMSLDETRFLIFDEKEYVMNNTETIEIPFATSHEVEIVSATLTFYHYNDLISEIADFDKTDTGADGSIIEFYDGKEISHTIRYEDRENTDTKEKIFDIDLNLLKKNILSFSHPIVVWTAVDKDGEKTHYNQKDELGVYFKPALFKKNTQELPLSRYDIEITLRHKKNTSDPSDTQYPEETIHITQYPFLYMETEYNDGGTKLNESGKPTGYVIVNSNDYYGEKSWLGNTQNNYRIVNGLGVDRNANPNMYIFTVTNLSENQPYIIGDPRTITPNINLNPKSFEGTDMLSGFSISNGNIVAAEVAAKWHNGSIYNSSYLSDYYPAEENYRHPITPGNSPDFVDAEYKVEDIKGRTYKMIAPKFRISSGYSYSVTQSFVKAHARCASYQEMGYPAGRWRLPTRAELEFITTLQKENKIPSLFTSSDDYGYWTAQGSYHINNDGSLSFLFISSYKQAYVRCVYDDWYWVKSDGSPDRLPEDQWYNFYWGDKPKDNTQTN